MKNDKQKRTGRWILLALLLILAFLLLINRYTVRQVWCNLFSPTLPLDESTDWSGGKSYEHLRYAEDSEAQYIDLYVPDTEETAPLFVLIHGGGFAFNDAQSRQAQFMYRFFRDHGFACASVNYRLSTEAAYPAAICDVKAAVRFLCRNADEYGLDAGRIAVWGESAGGYLAAMAALSAPEAFSDTLCIGETAEERFVMPAFDALVDYYGCIDFVTQRENFAQEGLVSWIPTVANGWANQVLGSYDSLEELWLRKRFADWGEEEIVEASPLRRAQRQENENPSLRTLIVHGDADITVSQLQSVELFDALNAIGGNATLKLVPECKHADDRLFTDKILGEVESFLRAAFQS
jgi:acetyl esterase/lipase